MTRSPYHSMALATAMGLALTGFNATAAAQQPQEQQQRLEDRREQRREQQVRILSEEQRRLTDNQRMQAMNDRAKWVEQRKRKLVLGVLLAPDAQSGVRIAGVTPNSAAAEAGLKSGDRVISIDGRQVLGSSGELRVENARKLLGRLDSKTPVRLVYLRDGRDGVAVVTPRLDQQVFLLRGDGAPMAFGHDGMLAPGVAPKIRRELIRIGPGGDCKGEHCRLPMLAEAFRWNGLNLASLDAQLGRYFGTDHGVLVLSTGPELAGLQSGDVIRRIDGKPVDTPREAMEALRGKSKAAGTVAIEYLRDRKPGNATVKIPEAMPLRIPVPPAPPAPPRPPVAPPPPPPPPGTAFEFEIEALGDVDALALLPMPPAAPLPPLPPQIVEDSEVEAR